MMKTTILPLAAVTVLLAGCMPPPAYPPAPMAAPVPALAPVEPIPAAASGISGLQERQPDLCHAKDYAQHLSQPGSIIPTLGISRSYRVVEYRGIEPQEYDPNRIVFRLDSAGNIQNIDCG